MTTMLTRRPIAILPALALAAATLAAGAGDPPSPGDPDFPEYVLERIDDQYRGEQSHGIMKMHVKKVHWTRDMKLEAWTLGTEYSLIRILEPKKERGTATLKAGNDLFTYLSKTDKTIKITSGMMGSSWMGSHFTNDDLVQESRMSDDYDSELVFSGYSKPAKTDIHRFKLTPKPDAAVVWGKLIVSVRADDLQPLRVLYYDEDGKKVRALKFFGHEMVEGRVRPMKMVMKPLDGSGERTSIVWKSIEFDVDLGKSFFSIQQLKSM
jgi:hypothetical protein